MTAENENVNLEDAPGEEEELADDYTPETHDDDEEMDEVFIEGVLGTLLNAPREYVDAGSGVESE